MTNGPQHSERPRRLDLSRPFVGRVIGTEGATPLEFWAALAPGRTLQLDDVVALERTAPGRDPIRIYGIVTQIRARHEGARFDSDVFLIEDGILPAEVTEAAQILATRFEPEVFMPPLPGQAVRRAEGQERDEALFFDGMERRLAAGLSRENEPVYINLEFVDGTRGAHVNISGVSGVATKTTYATFLLHSLFNGNQLGREAINTKALIFNVKGEDLLWLDCKNVHLDGEQADRSRHLGLEPTPFHSVQFWAPPRRGVDTPVPDTGSRTDGVVRSFFWTIADFCSHELLPFLFADPADDRQQYTMIVHNVAARLRKEATALSDGGVVLEGEAIRTFSELIELIQLRVEDDMTQQAWAGRAIGTGTINAFIRRLFGAQKHVEHLIRGGVQNPDKHRIDRQAQVTVVDIDNLNDRAKRFVAGVVLRRALDEKERSGVARPLEFIVLDELNKYAPREGSSPIKEILLDVAERGRSIGIILIGAQQTASEVERRAVANSAIRVVGRLDSAEAGRDEYGFLPTSLRQRPTIAKPGTMILAQPQLPIPIVLEFPFPAWATRHSETGPAPRESAADADPFAGIGEADIAAPTVAR